MRLSLVLSVVPLSVSLVCSVAAAQAVDTISAGTRRFDRSPRVGVDTVDGFSVLGDSSRLAYTLIRTTTREGSIMSMETQIGAVRYFSRWKLDPYTPLESRSVSPRDSAAVQFQGEFVKGWVVEAGKAPEEVEHEFGDDIIPFDNGAREVFAQILPLADNYAAAFRIFDPYQNKGEWWSLRVLGSESLTHHGKRVDCWIVETTIPGSPTAPTHRLWVSKSNRLILQDRNMRSLPDGRTMIARAR
jgi:hypothetical protein